MKVSVIIPAYNCGGFIRQAMDSVLGQTFKDIEIIVVDDGSTDETGDIVRGYGDRIIYIRQDNEGHARARNAGLRMARGQYCAFLDADDYWDPVKVELQVAALDNDRQAGIVHCDLTQVDVKGKVVGAFHRDKRYVAGNIFEHLLLRREHIATSAALFRRDCFERLGLLDETMREVGNEDREFWLRISKHYPVVYIDRPLVFYRVRKESLSRNRKTDKMVRGRYLAIDKSLADIRPGVYAAILKRRAYGAIHSELGYSFLREGRMRLARRNYLQTIGCWPFQIRPWMGYLKTVLTTKGNHESDT